MQVFVTGASGHIGSAVVAELLGAGHQVVGLARSDNSAAAVKAAGAEVKRGDLNDLGSLSEAAAASDGVIHLAFGSLAAGMAESLDAGRGVRSSVVRLPPLVHSELDRHGLLPGLIGITRAQGVSGYVADGANRWPAVHTLDAARLYRLAVEHAPARSRLHAVAEDGVPFRELAEAIARKLDIATASLAPERFSYLSPFVALDNPVSSDRTRQLLSWQPARPTVVEDLGKGFYFER